MTFSREQLSSNTGLLDARGTAQVLVSLSSRFTAVEFSDFCTVAEDIVLRDQIVIVGKLERLPRSHRAVLRPLLEAGVFVSLGEAFPVPELPVDARQLTATEHAIRHGLTSSSVEDATYEASRLLGGEAFYGVPATPLLRQLQHFGLVKRPLIENTVWDLAAQYKNLADQVMEMRSALQALSGLHQLPVPPIALRAIQRSKRYEQVIYEVLQLRDEMKPLRNSFREIEEQLRDGRLSPITALELQNAWRQRWERLAEKLGSSGRMAIARTSVPLLKNGLRITKCVVAQDALDAVVQAIGWIGPGIDALGGLQLRPVRRSVANYMSVTDQEILGAVARVFDADFTRIDADMTSLAFQAGSPWRMAWNDRGIENYSLERSNQRMRRRHLVNDTGLRTRTLHSNDGAPLFDGEEYVRALPNSRGRR